MKIKTNVRAGGVAKAAKPAKANNNNNNSSSINNTVVTYVPPVSRCVGI